MKTGETLLFEATETYWLVTQRGQHPISSAPRRSESDVCECRREACNGVLPTSRHQSIERHKKADMKNMHRPTTSNSDETPARLDIVEATGLSQSRETESRHLRRWIGVRFECCDVYTRIYRQQNADAYEGQCPTCGCPVRVRVGAEGLNTRFLTARPI